jgi:hypothetical protein
VTDTADRCAEELKKVAQERAELGEAERAAELAAQEAAAAKDHVTQRLTLLAAIDAASTAWEDVKADLKAQIDDLWSGLKSCQATLDAAVGADKDCLDKAYDGYPDVLKTLQKEADQAQAAVAAATAELAAAQSLLAESQAYFENRYAQFATYMAGRRDTLQAAATRFRTVMSEQPCDATTAYVLFREVHSLYAKIHAEADWCLPEKMLDLVHTIDSQQEAVRRAEGDKAAKQDKAKIAADKLADATENKDETIFVDFKDCKEAYGAAGAGAAGAGAATAAPPAAGATSATPATPTSR